MWSFFVIFCAPVFCEFAYSYYIGITNELDRRAIEHVGTGKLHLGQEWKHLTEMLHMAKLVVMSSFILMNLEQKPG